MKLFWSFIQVGLCSIGGGYAAMPLIQGQVVELNHWISMQEFADLVTIAEMTPGPIAINAATFVGFRIGGLQGALAATAGCILPSLLIVSLLAFFYFRYRNLRTVSEILGCLRPTVIALIGAAGVNILFQALSQGQMAWENVQWCNVVLFVAALFILQKKKWNPILVMSLCGVGSLIVGSI